MSHVKFDEETKVWTSCDSFSVPVYNPKISMSHIVMRSLELHGPKIAQISDDTKEEFTFEEIRMMTIRAAQNLQKRGYSSKEVTALITGDVAHLAPIVFASLCLGHPMSAMDSVWKPDLLRMLEMTKPRLIFCQVDKYDVVVECMADLGLQSKVFTFNGAKGDSEPVENLFVETNCEDDFVCVEIDGENDPAFIMSTSGSTGPSKGFCLTHAALFTEMDSVYFTMYANGVIYTPTPLHWIVGILALLLGTVYGSKRIITCEQFSAEMQLRLITKYKVTFLDNVPYDLIEMLKSGLLPKTDLSSIRHVVVGGYKVPLAILEEFNSYLPNGEVHNMYGLSETGGTSVDFPRFSGMDTVGKLTFGVKVKILDEKGNRCGINEDGELYIKSRHKIIGYYKNQKLTDQSLDSEGYFITGDIGHIDENGYLYIVDRKKFMICHADGWVYPADVEAALVKTNQIKNVCVVGIAVHDAVFEVPAAIVVRANGSKITESDVHKIVKDNLPEICQLSGGVYFVDSIPTTRTGKPNRVSIKETTTKLYKSKMINRTG